MTESQILSTFMMFLYGVNLETTLAEFSRDDVWSLKQKAEEFYSSITAVFETMEDTNH